MIAMQCEREKRKLSPRGRISVGMNVASSPVVGKATFAIADAGRICLRVIRIKKQANTENDLSLQDAPEAGVCPIIIDDKGYKGITSVNEQLSRCKESRSTCSYHAMIPWLYFAQVPLNQFDRLCTVIRFHINDSRSN